MTRTMLATPIVLTALLAAPASVAWGQCDPTDLFEPPATLATGSSEPSSLVSADLNGDGHADLITAGNAGTGFVAVLLGDGMGGFGGPALYPVLIGGKPNGLSVGDANGDGFVDVACINDDGIGFALLPGVGDGTLGAAIVGDLSAGDGRKSELIDLTGDGLLDLITVDVQRGGAWLLAGLGDGRFAAERWIAGAGMGSEAGLGVGDVDGDGDGDLAITDGPGNRVGILLNDGTGNFAAPAWHATGSNPAEPAIVDVTGDGRADVVVCNEPGSDVSILPGLGGGVLGPQARVPAGVRPGSVRVADLNGDGALDLLLVGSQEDAVALVLGVGDGRFASPILYGVGDEPTSLALLDANGDGSTDVATIDRRDEAISLLINRCPNPLRFALQPASTIVDFPGALVELSARVDAPASYQWQRDGVDLVDGPRISGATTRELTVFLQPGDAGVYACVATSGTREATSRPAVLAVRPNPCPADFDADGRLTIFDFLAFQNAFDAGCP